MSWNLVEDVKDIPKILQNCTLMVNPVTLVGLFTFKCHIESKKYFLMGFKFEISCILSIKLCLVIMGGQKVQLHLSA